MVQSLVLYVTKQYQDGRYCLSFPVPLIFAILKAAPLTIEINDDIPRSISHPADVTSGLGCLHFHLQ